MDLYTVVMKYDEDIYDRVQVFTGETARADALRTLDRLRQMRVGRSQTAAQGDPLQWAFVVHVTDDAVVDYFETATLPIRGG